MSLAEIQSAIPHRAPMLLLDEILERAADRIVCQKRFRADEFFVQGHYPGDPLVPGVILCECALQAGAVLLSGLAQGRPGVPVATRLYDAKFRHAIRPGDTLRIEVRLKERLSDAFFLNAKLLCQGQLAARLDFACALAELAPYHGQHTPSRNSTSKSADHGS